MGSRKNIQHRAGGGDVKVILMILIMMIIIVMLFDSDAYDILSFWKVILAKDFDPDLFQIFNKKVEVVSESKVWNLFSLFFFFAKKQVFQKFIGGDCCTS